MSLTGLRPYKSCHWLTYLVMLAVLATEGSLLTWEACVSKCDVSQKMLACESVHVQVKREVVLGRCGPNSTRHHLLTHLKN